MPNRILAYRARLFPAFLRWGLHLSVPGGAGVHGSWGGSENYGTGHFRYCMFIILYGNPSWFWFVHLHTVSLGLWSVSLPSSQVLKIIRQCIYAFMKQWKIRRFRRMGTAFIWNRQWSGRWWKEQKWDGIRAWNRFYRITKQRRNIRAIALFLVKINYDYLWPYQIPYMSPRPLGGHHDEISGSFIVNISHFGSPAIMCKQNKFWHDKTSNFMSIPC